MEIGSMLRQVREENGLTLQQVEEETKIRRKYIEALENERFDILPGPVYVKAFIKTYAKYLGLNGELLVSGLDEQADGGEAEDVLAEDVLKEKPSFSWKSRYWAYSMVVLLAGMVILFGTVYKDNNTARVETPLQQSEPANREENKHQPIKDTNERTEENQELILKLDVTSDKSWMLVKVDGNTAFEGTLRAGQSRDFTARENVWFRLGNTGAVQVYVNGKNQGYLGKKGAVEDFGANKQFPSIKKLNQDKQRTT